MRQSYRIYVSMCLAFVMYLNSAVAKTTESDGATCSGLISIYFDTNNDGTVDYSNSNATINLDPSETSRSVRVEVSKYISSSGCDYRYDELTTYKDGWEVGFKQSATDFSSHPWKLDGTYTTMYNLGDGVYTFRAKLRAVLTSGATALIDDRSYTITVNGTPPDAPSALAIGGSLGSPPSLTWNASSGAVTYSVYRCTASTFSTCTSFSLIANGVSSTSYTDWDRVIQNGCGSGVGDEVTRYYVKAINGAGSSDQSNTETTCTDLSKGGPESYTTVPATLALHKNFPDPFNPSTTISFDLSETGYAQLEVTDMWGRVVIRLVDEELEAGTHSVVWNADGFASGVYIYRLTAGNVMKAQRMVLLK